MDPSRLLMESPEANRARRRKLNSRVFPRLRAFGFLVLGLMASLQGVLLPQTPVDHALLWAVLTTYSLGAGLLLRHVYAEQGPRQHLALLLFTLDIPVFVWVVYMTGAGHSLLFPILLVRIADQTNFSLRRVLGFTAVTLICYLAMLGWVGTIDRVPLDARAETVRFIVLFGCGVYVAFTAGTGQSLRRRLVRAVKMLQESLAELEHRNRELRVARLEAETAVRTREKFLNNVSHELRTPLNAILGFCDLLRDDVRPEKRERYLTNIHKNGRSLLSMVERILDHTGSEAASSPVELSSLHFDQLLQPILPEFPTFKFVTRPTPAIEVDPTKLERAVRLMMREAFHLAGEAPVTLTLETRNQDVVLETRGPGGHDTLELDLDQAGTLTQMQGGRLDRQRLGGECILTLSLPVQQNLAV